MRYWISLFILLTAVGIYLYIRKKVDLRVEAYTDTEVVREKEEYLGTWASKSATGFVMFRLHRDGKLTYRSLEYPGKDTTIINGKYTYVSKKGGNDEKYFPRIYAFSDKGDTLFNYYVRYVTPYNSTIDKVDKLVLNPNGVLDTLAYVFYRIKQ